jgi:BON domain
MKKQSILKTTLVLFAFMAIFGLSVSAQKTDCSKTTDSEITDAILGKIKVKYADQMSHINVSVENGVVSLQGWTADKKAIKEIGKLAKKTSCVKSVVNNIKQGITNGCGSGTKPCGDICIPSTDTCNIGKGKGN